MPLPQSLSTDPLLPPSPDSQYDPGQMGLLFPGLDDETRNQIMVDEDASYSVTEQGLVEQSSGAHPAKSPAPPRRRPPPSLPRSTATVPLTPSLSTDPSPLQLECNSATDAISVDRSTTTAIAKFVTSTATVPLTPSLSPDPPPLPSPSSSSRLHRCH